MYTSGRTVKSSKPQATTVASATAEARRLINRHLRGVSGVTVESKTHAHGATLAAMVKTTITYPEDQKMILEPRQSRTAPLADAITGLPGYESMCWNSCSITFLRYI